MCFVQRKAIMTNITYNPYTYKKVAKELKIGLIQHLDVILGQVKNIVKNNKINDVPNFNEVFKPLTDLSSSSYLDFYENFTYFNFYSLVNSKDVFKLPISEISSLFIFALKVQPQIMLFKNDFNEKFIENNIGREVNIKGEKRIVPLTLEQLSVTSTAECLEYWHFQDKKEQEMVFEKMLFSFPETIYYIKKTKEYEEDEDYRRKINQKSLAFHVDSLLFMDSDDQSLIAFDSSFLPGIKNFQEEKIKNEQLNLAKKGIKVTGKTDLQIRFEKDFKLLEGLKERKIKLNEIIQEKFNAILGSSMEKVKTLDMELDNYIENGMVNVDNTPENVPEVVVELKQPTYENSTPDVQIIKNNVDLSAVYGNNVTKKTEKPKDVKKSTNDNDDDFDLS